MEDQISPIPASLFPLYLRNNNCFICLLSEQDFVVVEIKENTSGSLCGKDSQFVENCLFEEDYQPIERPLFIEAILKANEAFKQYAILENKLKA